jgi:PTH1 family peptidyl-tRNA hydrolase
MSGDADSIHPKVIVGLGNPGEEYAGTRHNAGFLVIDRILEKLNKPSRREHRYNSEIVRVTFGGRQLILVKPLTFMNLSGTAVAKGRAAWDVVPEEILVVYDCLDLPAGKIRLRQDGGSGGHRGMESLIKELGARTSPASGWGSGARPGNRWLTMCCQAGPKRSSR